MSGTRCLYIGIGGGGDIVATLADYLRNKEASVVAGLTWKRRSHDPIGRPRRIGEFRNIRKYNDAIGVVTPETTTYEGVRHIEAHVSELIGEPVLTIDISGGVFATAAAIEDYMKKEGISRVFGIDVGGDVLCNGDEPTVRSPIADQVMLGSLVLLGTDSGSVSVFGLGADGELPLADFYRRIERITMQSLYATAARDRDLALMDRAMNGQTESSARAAEAARRLTEERRMDIADTITAQRHPDLRSLAGPARPVPLRDGRRTGELSNLTGLYLHLNPSAVYNASCFSEFVGNYDNIQDLAAEMRRRGIATEFDDQ
ncbi:MAG: DUF1152 domain-containing protein [Candidatus Aenigmarchaeota archaeon]|nr:DUF1152 domain-containing protein [Candidatus Aenigmarchaeota archaeon]